MDQKNIKGKIGALMTVPNNVTGSPRWLRDRFENAVALSNKLGRPDLFITATTNTQWPELKVSSFYYSKKEVFLEDYSGRTHFCRLSFPDEYGLQGEAGHSNGTDYWDGQDRRIMGPYKMAHLQYRVPTTWASSCTHYRLSGEQDQDSRRPAESLPSRNSGTTRQTT